MRKAIGAAALCIAMAGCAGTAMASTFEDVSDRPAPIFCQRDVSAIERTGVSAAEVEGEPTCGTWEPCVGYEPAYEESAAYAPSDGLTAEGGVNYHGGRMETYYSSNVLVHQDIGEWSTDDEGFWRTDDGYYVVAASDMEQGTVFEGSKGECIVLDSGCADGTTDYYVNWL